MAKNIYNKIYTKDDWDAVSPENKLILNDYMLELRQRRLSQGTISQYFNDLRIYLIFIYKELGNKSILEMTRRDMKRYSLWLSEVCSVSVARHNRLWSSMKSFYNFCEEDEEIGYSNDIARKLKGLQREPVREIHFLKDEEVLRLKDELIRREEFQKATMLMLAYDSAARRNEIAQVKKASFYDETRNNTNKVIGKRRKIFPLIYFSETKKCAKLWLEQRGQDNFDSLWVYKKGNELHQANSNKIYRWFMEIRDIFNEIEGSKTNFNVHSMRHSALQNMSDGSHYICRERGIEKIDLQDLKKVAKHEDISTTQGYLKEDDLAFYGEMFNINIVDD